MPRIRRFVSTCKVTRSALCVSIIYLLIQVNPNNEVQNLEGGSNKYEDERRNGARGRSENT